MTKYLYFYDNLVCKIIKIDLTKSYYYEYLSTYP